MKKYLMSGIAVIAFAAAFTSCSKSTDLYEEGRKEKDQAAQNEQKVAQSYEEAFEAAFGKPAANQDWGLAKYGTPSNNAGTRGMSTNLSNADKKKPAQPTFRPEIDMPTEYKNTLADAIGDGAKELTSNYTSGGKYYIDGTKWDNNKPNAISIEGHPLILYFDGDITFYGYNCQNSENGIMTTYCVTKGSTLRVQNIRNGLKVYLAPGATLDLTGIDGTTTFQNSNAGIYICEGCSLKANRLSLVNDVPVLNNGTIEAQYIELDNKTLFYNNNLVKLKTGDGILKLKNENAEFVNKGTLEANALDMKAGGKFNNVGTTTISGATDLTNTNSWWENDNKYTSGSFYINNARRVYNNCKLTVTGNFHLKEGEFVLNGGDKAGASLKCNSFTFELNPDFWMGSKSLLLVEGELKTLHSNQGYGIRGIGNDYAVIKAGSITKEGNQWNANPPYQMTYYGKLFIDTQSHFPDNTDQNNPYYAWGPDVKFSFNKETSPVVIEADEKGCNPGYKQKINVTYQGRVMGEDLTAENDNDFDFNDVVFDWAFSTDGKTAYIKLYACGGTMPLKIGKAVGEGEEVHALFNVGTGTMVNTGVGTSGITKEPVEFTITSETEGTFRTAADIIVSVDKTKKGAAGYMQMESTIGGAPCLLFVPLETKWVDEYVNIEKAYTWFGAWVRGETSDQWTSAPVEKYVDLNLSNND